MAEQLCWSCSKACGGCSWSSALIAIEDWEAREVKGGSFDIKNCPEYEYDGRCLRCEHYSSFPIDAQYYHIFCKHYKDSGYGSCRNFKQKGSTQ